MSQWGVFHDEDGKIHVAPVLPDGRLSVRHSLHEFCQCGVRAEQTRKRNAEGYLIEIWVHQDPEKGGCDS
jgi:hypothetical protein